MNKKREDIPEVRRRRGRVNPTRAFGRGRCDRSRSRSKPCCGFNAGTEQWTHSHTECGERDCVFRHDSQWESHFRGKHSGSSAANTRVIDLKGRTVVPGLIEAHIHSVSLAIVPGITPSWRTPLRSGRFRKRSPRGGKTFLTGQWITSMGGWHPNQWAEHRHPTLEGTRCRRSGPARSLYERFTGPCATNSLGKRLLRCGRCRPSRTSGYQAVQVSATGAIAAAGFAGGGPRHLRCISLANCRPSKTRSAARGCDELFRQCRYLPPISTRCCFQRRGRCIPARFCPTSISTGCTTLGWPPPRRPDHRPPADELSPEPNDPICRS